MPEIAKTRVLLLARELGGGGSERQLVGIAKYLDPSQFDVTVGYFRTGMRSGELAAAGIRTLHLDVQSLRSPNALRQARILFHFLTSSRIHVVHAFDYPLVCYAVPIAKAARVPVVLSSQRGDRRLIPPAFRHFVRMTDLGVNGVVVNCRAMANHLNFEEDIPRQKTFLCYNGLELGNFPFRPAWREPRDNSPLVIGTVAMLRPEKNLDLLFNAAACLRNKGFDLKLLIVGDGPEKGRLQTIAATLGLSSVTEFIPTQWDVAPWLARMDIFVLPSRTEAFPNAVMEAMACGIPVIVSRVGGNPELVTENKTGLMFRSNDAAGLAAKLEALLRNHALRRSLSQAARQTIETRFSIEQSAQRMGEIYRQLLAQQPFSNQL